MATLRETAYYTKKIVKFGSISLLVIIILKLLFDVGKNIWLKHNPPAPPPPTVAFGKLPVLEFSQKQKIGDLEFKLETPTGKLPSLSSQAKIFPIPAQKARLLALEKAKKKATKLGFIEEPRPVSERIFRWKKEFPLNSLLEMDIFSETFNFSYSWKNQVEAITQKLPLNKEQAINEAKRYLNTIGILEDDLQEGEAIASYFKINKGEMVPAISLSEANFVKVDIFRKNIEEIPIVTAIPEKGIVTIILVGTENSSNQIVEVEFNYLPIDYDSFATYPLKTSADAWKDLKENRAFVANWEGQKNITIRRIYLAYFDSSKPQEYLQPIFIFEGDDDFTAYVAAITNQWSEPFPTGD